MTVERPLRKMLFLFREGVVLVTIFLILSCQYGTGAGQDIALVRTKPDVQQLPCPQQRVEFQCQIMVPSTGLTWTLPDGATLEFDGTSAVGDGANSSDNVYNATLTGKTEDGNIDSFFFTSTLLVLEPVNGSTLTCGADALENATATVIISGVPNPPGDLVYDNTTELVTSVDLQWTRPSYTGGVPLANYTVSSTNGLTGKLVVPAGGNETVSYATPVLVYGIVWVSAINSCGQKSLQASVSIAYSGYPGIDDYSINVLMYCTADSRPVDISWKFDPWQKGVAYPGVESIDVVLSPGYIICPINNVFRNSCRAIVPGDGSYKANFTQTTTMDRGFSKLFFSRTYDLRSLVLVADGMEPDYLTVTVRVNGYCNDSYTVTLAFGTGPKTGEVCKAGLNATSVTVLPGETNRFFTYTDSLPLPANHTYCYLINGVPHAFIDPGPNPDPSGSVVALSNTLLMILLVAVALG